MTTRHNIRCNGCGRFVHRCQKGFRIIWPDFAKGMLIGLMVILIFMLYGR